MHPRAPWLPLQRRDSQSVADHPTPDLQDLVRNGEVQSRRRGEVAAALVVVDLSAERTNKKSRVRDDMIRAAHRAGASIRQLAEVSGLGRKTVTVIVSSNGGRPSGS
jgi:hypothetical protein